MRIFSARMRWNAWTYLTNLSDWFASPRIEIRLYPLRWASDACWWLAENWCECTDEELHTMDREDGIMEYDDDTLDLEG